MTRLAARYQPQLHKTVKKKEKLPSPRVCRHQASESVVTQRHATFLALILLLATTEEDAAAVSV